MLASAAEDTARRVELRREALRALIPAPRLKLSDWMEREIVLPEGVSARPGRLRLYPYQRLIADCIGDPLIERVTLLKSVRVGFTTLITASIAAFVANDPAPILCLQPTEADAKDFCVSDLDPTFEASMAVSGTLQQAKDDGERTTLMHRRFPGGSLKVVAAKAPRNLRRHTARVLMIDEADAMEVSAEGSPIILAERRTMSFPDRKIVLGSTPLLEDTSHVLRAYAQSDQRVFEVPCPECATFTEMQWAHIEWETGRPETASFRCPSCKALSPERAKHAMVAVGRWRATHPEVVGHAGFRLNALVSTLANAAWSKLVAEFLRAKEDSDELQVFVNTILGQGWREAGVEVDEAEIAKRAEPFSLEALPEQVLVITAGTDVQDDRLETSILGFSRSEAFILGHFIFWGSPDEEGVWQQHDELLARKWAHPFGGLLGVDAAGVDSGDRTDTVYSYCFPRLNRKVFAVKGLSGTQPICRPSESKVRIGSRGAWGRLFLAGVDTIKATIYDRLARGRALRVSNKLEASYFEQLCSERKVVRYQRGQPVRRFERKTGMRAEALDCVVYGFAVRHLLNIDLNHRETALRATVSVPAVPVRRPIRSQWKRQIMGEDAT